MLEIPFSSIIYTYSHYWISLKINLIITVAKTSIRCGLSLYTRILGISKEKIYTLLFHSLLKNADAKPYMRRF